MFIDRALSAVVFALTEVGIICSHPKTYWQSVQRARSFGYFPFHAFPRTADEKFLWRKVFDHDPTFIRLSDKLALRDWLKETGLNLTMPPVLWAGFSPQAMPEEMFAGDIMIKANHDSGTCFPMWCDPLPRDVVLENLERALARDYSRSFGEWGYKGVAPRVFAEERIGRDGIFINDLKFYTFGRRIELIVHIQDREDGRYGQVFKPDGQGGFKRLERPPEVCDGGTNLALDGILERTVDLVRDLGAPFDHMRVDLLEADGDISLAEMTVYNQSGFIGGGGAKRDSQISRAWDIRKSWAMRARPGGIGKRIYFGLLKRALDRADAPSGLPPA